ncbi:hypothetical protein EON65_31895 [archaeon]|nr:MAG: hypothetical protein EON65_31895 [archaeon]
MSFSRPRFAPGLQFDGKDKQLKRKHSDSPSRGAGTNPTSFSSKSASNIETPGKTPTSTRSFKEPLGGNASSNMYEGKMRIPCAFHFECY